MNKDQDFLGFIWSTTKSNTCESLQAAALLIHWLFDSLMDLL